MGNKFENESYYMYSHKKEGLYYWQHKYPYVYVVKNQNDSKLKLSFIPSLKLCEIPKFVFGFDVVYNYKNTYEC